MTVTVIFFKIFAARACLFLDAELRRRSSVCFRSCSCCLICCPAFVNDFRNLERIAMYFQRPHHTCLNHVKPNDRYFFQIFRSQGLS